MENFSVFTSEGGIDMFKCSKCSVTFGSQKSIKSHITKKHTAKTDTMKTKENLHDGEHGDSVEDNFEFDGSEAFKSTQAKPDDEPPATTADIFKEYEEIEEEQTLEEESSENRIIEIPDDTVDNIMRTVAVDGIIDVNKDQEAGENWEKLMEEKNILIQNLEANLLSSQLEVSSLEEQLSQLKSE